MTSNTRISNFAQIGDMQRVFESTAFLNSEARNSQTLIDYGLTKLKSSTALST